MVYFAETPVMCVVWMDGYINQSDYMSRLGVFV